MTADEYFFYEWLIIEKDMTNERFKQLTAEGIAALQAEYASFMKALRGEWKCTTQKTYNW